MGKKTTAATASPVFEASELDWAPGQWPEEFERHERHYVRARPEYEHEELVAFHYECVEDGQIVIVLND